MRSPTTKILKTCRRVEAGRYYIETCAGVVYHAVRVVTEYGDQQWVIDRADECAWAHASTLYGVKATIIEAHRQALRAKEGK